MNLYKNYLKIYKAGKINHGFSPRLPDYATKYWFLRLEEATNSGNQKSFLDIGAGDGRLSLLLLKHGFMQGAAVEVAVNHQTWKPICDKYKNFQLLEGLFQDKMKELIDQNKTFDFIVLAEVFEHIPLSDVDPFLEQLSQLMSPEGRVFLTTPNFAVQGPAEKSHMWHERQQWGHHKHYQLSEVKDLFKKFGFEVENSWFECHNLKTKLYNKWFYPASRLDWKLMHSKKLPKALRSLYRYGSVPFIGASKLLFQGLSNLVYTIEKNKSTQDNAATMMLLVKKKS